MLYSEVYLKLIFDFLYPRMGRDCFLPADVEYGKFLAASEGGGHSYLNFYFEDKFQQTYLWICSVLQPHSDVGF